MENKIKFISGLYPKPTKTDWVLSNISVKKNEFLEELKNLKEDENGWVMIDLCQSKNGKQYFKENNFKPERKEVTSQEHSPDREDDLPF